MVFGYVASYNAKQRKHVGAFTATTNNEFTPYCAHVSSVLRKKNIQFHAVFFNFFSSSIKIYF